MTPVSFEREATEDALEAYDWYERQRPGLGARFRDALDSAIRRIAEAPTTYPIIRRNVRRVVVHRFPYAVYYRVYPEGISVIAVFHGKRNPRILRDR